MSSKPTALITGAASGLGRDLARLLSASHRLMLTDVNPEGLQTLSKELPEAHMIVADLGSEASINQLLGAVGLRTDSLDLLINNAGITHRSLASNTATSTYQKVMQVDYLAPVQITLGLLPQLKASKGQIVMIGSMAGWMPLLGRSGYCAAKSALAQFSETLRAELKPDGVKVLNVYPSFLDTPIEQNALDGQGGLAKHPRSSTGKIRSSEWMAQRILDGLASGKSRLYGDRFTLLSSLLYRLQPDLYLKLMSRRFASELDHK